MVEIHCDKGPLINQLIDDSRETHKKLDKVIVVLEAVAVQGEKVRALEGKLDALTGLMNIKHEDHERRIRCLEPLRSIYIVVKWIAGIGSALVTVYLIYLASTIQKVSEHINLP